MTVARKLDDPAAGFSQRGRTRHIQVFSRPTGDLRDTYTLKEVLGKGHSGEVRVAEHSSGNRYACKTIAKESLKVRPRNAPGFSKIFVSWTKLSAFVITAAT